MLDSNAAMESSNFYCLILTTGSIRWQWSCIRAFDVSFVRNLIKVTRLSFVFDGGMLGYAVWLSPVALELTSPVGGESQGVPALIRAAAGVIPAYNLTDPAL